MEFLKSYIQTIEKELIEIDIPNQPGNLYEPLRYFLQIGGKRIRPVLTLMGTELFGLAYNKAIHAALAIELFHNFTLIHDDIMDEAPLRRGFDTVHHKWNTNTAILSGDVLLIKAYQQLYKQDGDLRALLNIFNRVAIDVCEGQQLDMDFENEVQVSIDDYINMIRLKTSVLLGASLELGAVIANANEHNKKAIYNFGVNIGIAFQIQDDILDLYADASKFGKQVGGDVLADKKTILYLLALEHGTNDEVEKLKKLKTETNKNKKIEETKKIFNQIKVKELSQQLLQHYFQKAIDELNTISVNYENKQKLHELAHYLINRDI